MLLKQYNYYFFLLKTDNNKNKINKEKRESIIYK